jgi:hypothetical protein
MLKERLSMEQPEVCTLENAYWVWRLEQSLYGLAQAGRTWNGETNLHMLSEGLAATPRDPTVYVKNIWDREDFVAPGFCVDEFVGIGYRKELEALANGIDAKYRVTLLRGGQMGPRCADRSVHTISISQGAFIDSILTRFNLTNVAPCHDTARTGYSFLRGRLEGRDGDGDEGVARTRYST